MNKGKTVFSAEDLRRFARYEEDYETLVGGTDVFDEGKISEKSESYHMTLEDLMHALQHVKDQKIETEAFYYSWLVYLTLGGEGRWLQERLHLAEKMDAWTKEPSHLPVTEADYICEVFEALDEIWMDDGAVAEAVDLDSILETEQYFKENAGKPEEERDYPLYIKYRRVTGKVDAVYQHELSGKELETFVRFTDELCAAGNPEVMEIKGYMCYEGTDAYPQNFKMSRLLLSASFEQTLKPQLANSLGYIYYYGRTTGGKPDYDQAFRYFSYGAASKVVESTYKLADMYAHGYGIWKNPSAAFALNSEVYRSCLPPFLAGQTRGKFADTALRMGLCYENGWGTSPDAEKAYHYDLQALYAIRLRRAQGEAYGDEKVEQNIVSAVERMSKASREMKLPAIELCDRAIQRIFHNAGRLRLRVKKEKDDGYRLIFRHLPETGAKKRLPFLLTSTQQDFCVLEKKIVIMATGDADIGDTVLDKDIIVYGCSVRPSKKGFILEFSDTGKKDILVTARHFALLVREKDKARIAPGEDGTLSEKKKNGTEQKNA